MTDVASRVAAPVRRSRNKLAVTAFALTIAVYLLPVIATIVAFAAGTSGNIGAGWAALGALLFAAFGFAIGSPLAIIAVVLAILSLFARNRGKALGIISLIFALGPAVVGALLIPLTLQELGLTR